MMSTTSSETDYAAAIELNIPTLFPFSDVNSISVTTAEVLPRTVSPLSFSRVPDLQRQDNCQSPRYQIMGHLVCLEEASYEKYVLPYVSSSSSSKK